MAHSESAFAVWRVNPHTIDSSTGMLEGDGDFATHGHTVRLRVHMEGDPMTALNARAREALAAGHLAHLVTLNRDGGPQLTVVWVGLEGDELVTAHLHESQKVRNVRRDPRVMLSLVTGGRNEIGLDEYLVVNGVARVTDGGAAQLLQRLARVYIGPDVKFPPMDDPPQGFVLRITPERVGGVGPWS